VNNSKGSRYIIVEEEREKKVKTGKEKRKGVSKANKV
jgi:hypothetical protein